MNSTQAQEHLRRREWIQTSQWSTGRMPQPPPPSMRPFWGLLPMVLKSDGALIVHTSTHLWRTLDWLVSLLYLILLIPSWFTTPRNIPSTQVIFEGCIWRGKQHFGNFLIRVAKSWTRSNWGGRLNFTSQFKEIQFVTARKTWPWVAPWCTRKKKEMNRFLVSIQTWTPTQENAIAHT